MSDELAKGIALSTAWVVDDMESWAELAAKWIEQDALDLVGELSHIVGQLAKSLALIEGPDLFARDRAPASCVGCRVESRGLRVEVHSSDLRLLVILAWQI